MHGTFSARFLHAGGGGTSLAAVGWNFPTIADGYGRFYFNIQQVSTSTADLCQGSSQGHPKGHRAERQLHQANGGWSCWHIAISTNTWYRVEFHHNSAATCRAALRW
jgi:hypothetical protein